MPIGSKGTNDFRVRGPKNVVMGAISNIIEFALGLNPVVVDGFSPIWLELSDHRALVRLPALTADVGLMATIEASESLRPDSWKPVSESVPLNTETHSDLSVEVDEPFLRVRLEMAN